MGKPNCYECKYRGTLVGSCHSCCKHPVFEKALSDPLLALMGIFASVSRIAPIQIISEKVVIKGNPHGIRKGWFNHPYNFDPVWLEKCSGFEPKIQKEESEVMP